MRFITVILAAAVTAGAVRAQQKPSAPAPSTATQPWTLKIAPVQTPAATVSSGPQLTSSSRGVLLSWIENDDDKSTLKFAERGAAAGWSAPQISASGSDWFLTDADTPAVLRLSNGTLAANWIQSTDDEVEASNLRLSYSKDDGKTWAPSFLPHHDGTTTQHAFAALFEIPGPGLGVVWLDGRQTVKDRDKGAMSLRYAAFDGQWRQRADVPIDAKVCDCCTTSVAKTTGGSLTVFRNRTDAEVRDIYASRFVAGKWTAGTAVHVDGWRIDACPVNGPVVSARGRDAVVAWFVAKNDEGQAYAAFSTDAGRTWGQPIRLDDGSSLGRVDIEMLEDGSAVATWVEFADKRSQLRVKRVERSGAKSAAIVVAGASGGRVNGVPRLARFTDQLVFAWTEIPERGGQGQVKTAAATLPH